MVFKPFHLHFRGVAVQPPAWYDGSPVDRSWAPDCSTMLINHCFSQVTISTLDLDCLAKGLDMIPINMDMIRVTDVFCRGPMERTSLIGNY